MASYSKIILNSINLMKLTISNYSIIFAMFKTVRCILFSGKSTTGLDKYSDIQLVRMRSIMLKMHETDLLHVGLSMTKRQRTLNLYCISVG